jgi:septal ring factor EnvC (AmiA/AmiB activator)
MRAAIALLLCLLLGGSASAQVGESLDSQLKAARAEQAAAEAETSRLDGIAAKARNEADRLHAQQAAAAQAIEAAEARITSADTRLRLASAYVAAHREQLVAEQRPASLLLAGLAVMARRPPLLALAGGGSTDELVKVRILLDSTLPAIRARAGRISAELEQSGCNRQCSRRAPRRCEATRTLSPSASNLSPSSGRRWTKPSPLAAAL